MAAAEKICECAVGKKEGNQRGVMEEEDKQKEDQRVESK